MSYNSANRARINQRDSLHEDHNYTDYIPKGKVPAFIKLFKRISLIRGSNENVYRDLMLARDTLSRMNSGTLSKGAAAKIMDGYNKYVKNYLNGGIINH